MAGFILLYEAFAGMLISELTDNGSYSFGGLMNEDTIKGTARKVEGAVESAYGNVTGNKSTEARGELHKAAGVAQNAAGEAEDKVLNLAGRMTEKFRGLVDTASDDISHATQKVNASIHEKPVRSTIVALGLGFLIGALISR